MTGVRAFVFGQQNGLQTAWIGRTGPMADFRIKVDTREVQKKLSDLSEKGIKDATAFALNITAARCKNALITEMKSVFDNPTPFTLNAFRVERASSNKLEATIVARDWAAKGTAAGEYLKPQVYGGTRPMKKFEKALSPLSGGQYIVPGPGARLDQYGNMSRGQIVQILSRFNLMRDQLQNMSERTAQRLVKQKKNARSQRSEYFIAREGRNGRPKGIFQLVGKGKVVPVLWFVQKRPTYSVRFKVDEVVDKTAEAQLPSAIESAIKGAIKRGMGK